jgi:pimeloyl-ACP methyl ester carboxylesterase
VSERYRPDPVQWRPCPENATLECGTLILPVDYREPQGETFELAVLRAGVTDPARRIGVLMTNPGGPGVSGVDSLLRGIAIQAPIIARLRERFDVIGFDVRGSHRSRAVRCDVEPTGAPTNLDDAALISFFNHFGQRVAQACLEQNGQFITTLSTNTIARDMDVLRRALGEKQLSYAGSSYGTTYPFRGLRQRAIGVAPAGRPNER